MQTVRCNRWSLGHMVGFFDHRTYVSLFGYSVGAPHSFCVYSRLPKKTIVCTRCRGGAESSELLRFTGVAQVDWLLDLGYYISCSGPTYSSRFKTTIFLQTAVTATLFVRWLVARYGYLVFSCFETRSFVLL